MVCCPLDNLLTSLSIRFLFLSSIVCNDEFSSRLSINSILRLRSAAIRALSDNSPADTAMIQKLARRILNVNKYHDNGPDGGIMEDYSARHHTFEGNYFILPFCSFWTNIEELMTRINLLCCSEPFFNLIWIFNKFLSEFIFTITGRAVSTERRFPHQDAPCTSEPDLPILQNGINGYNGSNSSIDVMSSQGLHTDCDAQTISLHGLDSGSEQRHTSYRDIPVEPPEMFLPGLVVHIERQRRSLFPLWKCWSLQGSEPPYKAFFAKRENFTDLAVTPSMFTDHLPWR